MRTEVGHCLSRCKETSFSLRVEITMETRVEEVLFVPSSSIALVAARST